MEMTLKFPPELEERLSREAARRGISTADYVIEELDRHVPGNDRAAKLIALLQSWMDEPNAAEQKETGDFLVRALDEDRPSERKLFPPELQGVTW